MTVKLCEDFGNFKKDTEYKLVRRGRDWIQLLNDGKAYYVPSKIEAHFTSRKKENEDEEEEYQGAI
jgi:hypothetical protein